MSLIKNLLNRKICIAISVFTLVILIGYFYWTNIPIKEVEYAYDQTIQSSSELSRGKIFEYAYTSDLDSITDMQLPIGTYLRYSGYPINAGLYYTNGSPFEEWVIIPAESGEGDFIHKHHLLTPFLEKEFVLKFTSEAPTGKGATLLITKGDATERGIMTMNGVVLPGDLYVDFYSENVSESDAGLFRTSSVIFVIMLLGFSYISIYLLHMVNRKISWHQFAFFLIMMLGILYILTITPYSAPDEVYHVNNTEALSNNLFLKSEPSSSKIIHASGVEFKSMRNDVYGYFSLPLMFSREAFQEYTGSSGSAGDYPIMYIPQAIGVSIATLLGFNGLAIFYFGRLINLVFFAITASLAVKVAPKQFKLSFLILLITPQILNIAGSYNRDNFVNALVALYVAYVLKYILDDVVMSKRAFAVIVILGMLIAPAKVIYFPITAIFIFIPSKNFPSSKIKIFATVILAAAVLTMVGVFTLDAILGTAGGAFTSDATQDAESASIRIFAGWEGIPTYSMGWFINNPARGIELILSTITDNGIFYLTNTFLGFLGAVQIKISALLTWPMIFLILITLLGTFENDKTATVIQHEQKLYLGVIITGCFLLVLMSMLSWTSTTQNAIQGVQGRYLIPITFLVAVVAKGRGFMLSESSKKVIIALAVLINISAIINIIIFTLG